MRVGTVVGVTVILALTGAPGGVIAQQKDKEASEGVPLGWWGKLWGKKAEPTNSAAADSRKENKEASPSATEAAAAIQARAREALFRRQEVCDKLRLIAIQTHDEALLRQAEQLNDRAWELYQRCTAVQHLPTAPPARTETLVGSRPVPPASRPTTASDSLDEEVLSRHLGGEQARGTVPPPPNFLLRAQDADASQWTVRREP